MPASPVSPSAPSDAPRIPALARAVTGRRSWIALLALILVAGAVFAFLSAPASSGAPESLPADAESSLVSKELAAFPDGGIAPAIAVATRTDGAELTTAQGATIKVKVKTPKKNPRIILVEKDRNDRNPRVILSQVDINKGNKQIAHGINRVLRPVNL